MTSQLSTMSTMWSKSAHVQSYFETTLQQAIHLDHMVLTIQDTGAGPSLDDVTSILEARSRLRIAHENMVEDMREFVESDIIFTKHPHFYLELITLEETTGDTVDESLSISKDYLTGITDIKGLFEKSIDICSDLSSQIHCLTNKSKDLSRDEIENLLDMENHSTDTFYRMEKLWKRITREAKSGEDTVIFPKLNDKIKKARIILQQTHSSYQAYRPNKNNQPTGNAGEPRECSNDKTRSEHPDNTNVVFHVKGMFANLQAKEHITARTNFGGDLDDDDEQNDARRQTADVVKRQLVTNETVTFPRPPPLRRLTDDVVQRQHTTNRDTTLTQLAQENHETSPPNTEC